MSILFSLIFRLSDRYLWDSQKANFEDDVLTGNSVSNPKFRFTGFPVKTYWLKLVSSVIRATLFIDCSTGLDHTRVYYITPLKYLGPLLLKSDFYDRISSKCPVASCIQCYSQL